MDVVDAYRFAVETTAELEVLRQGLACIAAVMLERLPKATRGLMLDHLEGAMSEFPPGGQPSTPEEMRFFKAVAEAAPAHAKRFTETVRHMLD